MDFEKLTQDMHSLIIFREILNNKAIKHLINFISTSKDNTAVLLDEYSAFCNALIMETENLSDYILNLVLESENPYVLSYCKNGGNVSPQLNSCLGHELSLLEEISRLSADEIGSYINYQGTLFKWSTTNYNFKEIYHERIAHISEQGYGIFAKYYAFTFNGADLIPVKNPDFIPLNQLRGYEEERAKVYNNTVALIEGKPASNVLLYGDAGTGKSTTVKAIAYELKNRGIRLIELTKNQMKDIPTLIDILSQNPLKFIIFTDDLSFTKDDDNFSSLKAILEGSVASKASNVIVYATSNRRHLIKETFSSRDGDDIHQSDTREEMISLSARFGLTVIFVKPDKKLYMQIIEKLAAENNIDMDYDALMQKAEAFAIRKGGRSPRTARQFINSLFL